MINIVFEEKDIPEMMDNASKFRKQRHHSTLIEAMLICAVSDLKLRHAFQYRTLAHLNPVEAEEFHDRLLAISKDLMDMVNKLNEIMERQAHLV